MQQVRALLAIAKRWGLWAAIAVLLILKLSFAWDARLEAVSLKLDAQAASDVRQLRLLAAICKGVNRDNPQALVFCDQ